MDKDTRKRLDDLEAILDKDTPASNGDLVPTSHLQQAESEELTDKQLLFVEEYLVDRIGYQAAIRAGYKEDSARQQASRLLTNDNIRKAITIRQNELNIQAGIKHQMMVNMLLEKATMLEVRLMDMFEVGDYNSTYRMWLETIKEINKISGFYSMTIQNVNIEIPLFPDLDNSEDTNYTEVK